MGGRPGKRERERDSDRQTGTVDRRGIGRARDETDIGRIEGVKRQGRAWGHREGGGGRGGELTVQCSQFTVYDSRFTIHGSRFKVNGSPFTVHGSRFTVHV